jgi:hypothetical protein
MAGMVAMAEQTLLTRYHLNLACMQYKPRQLQSPRSSLLNHTGGRSVFSFWEQAYTEG